MSNSRQILQWVDENDARIVYRLRPRARTIRINIDNANRKVSVTVPQSQQKLAEAKRFVKTHTDWINVQLEALPPPMPFVDGGTILFRGERFTLINPGGRGRPYVDRDTRTLVVPAPEGALPGRAKRFLIRQARMALEDRTHHHAQKLGKTVEKISVRDTASRWGSCVTRRGKSQINYSWRVICAPPFVLDYLCAHECAHMVHMDHSKNFWALCDTLVDCVKPANVWLKKNGSLLHAVGAEA